ncbi:MAG: YfhO family protein [Oscillospiraceae bacterium]|nr:YfhO family protein [Oscillospiraceae bacterium]
MSNIAAADIRGTSALRERIKGIMMTVLRFMQRNYVYFLSFLVPAVVLFVAYIIFDVWPFGERSVLSLDLNAQYVYYFDYIYDVLAGDESLFYSWSRNLSGEFAGIIGYYLASPFNILVWMWDRAWITEGLLTMMLAKAGACGLAMTFLLKKHRGYSDVTSFVFSVSYALCGFFVVQTMDPMWLDGLVALPLVAMGVERVCDKRRFKLYALSLVYIFVANFYIGYMVGIFSALYFLFYLASGKSTNKQFGEYYGATLMYGAASVSAILMSCFMILPVYKSLSNGKFEFTEPDFSLAENFDIADTFIKLFPTTYDTVRMEGMPALYAGTLVLVFAVIYFVARKISVRERISAAVLVGVLFMCMFIRPVDMLWHGGQMPNWLPYRYSFVISFLIVIFGAQAFEKIKSVQGRSFGVAFGILLAMLLFADMNNDSEYYDAVITVAVPLAMLAIMCIAGYAFRKYRDTLGMKISLSVLVCAELLMNTTVTLFEMHDDIVFSNRSTYRWDIPLTRVVTDEIHEVDEDFYRMEKTFHRCVNDPIALRMYGMSHSSSTLNARAISFMGDLGYTSREHYTRYDGATVLTDDIFGVRYVLTKDDWTVPYTEKLSLPDYESALASDKEKYSGVIPAALYENAETPITVYKNPDAHGVAFLADDDVLQLDKSVYIEDGVEFGSPFRLQNALAASLIGDNSEVFKKITDLEFDSDNIRSGQTTDAHHSYRKKDEEESAWIAYTITAQADGPVYMYLPTIYERETQLYVDDEYRGTYYKYENYSIEYIGTYSAGESFEVKLKLLENAVYFKEAQFYYADMDVLEQFNSAVREMNSGTTLTRTNGSRLELQVDNAEDRVLFTTIPAEEGWTAYIDGKKAELTSTMDGALVALNVPSGKHDIVLDFVPAGLKTGLIMTFSGILLFVIMILTLKMMRKKEQTVLFDDTIAEETE